MITSNIKHQTSNIPHLRHKQCWACWTQRACDVWFAKRGKVWVKEVTEYMSPAQANKARRVLKFNTPKTSCVPAFLIQ